MKAHAVATFSLEEVSGGQTEPAFELRRQVHRMECTLLCRTADMLFAIALAIAAFPASAQHRAESKNLELVGFNDLQARSAYQPVIENKNGRWIAYIGHHGGTASMPGTGPRRRLPRRRPQRHVAY
jgi:hypothetical protein